MYAASREALAHTRSALQDALASSTASAGAGAATAAAAQAGSELFSVVEVLDGQRTLRGALADASTPGAVRQALAEQVFGGKVSAAALATVKAAVGQDWSAQSDLTNSLVQLGREALLKAAEDQNQLDTVEDELFRLGRIVAGDAAFEQALSDRTATAESKRALLGQVLYGKVTAVTEALASQAVARPEGMPADDIDALSRMAAEIEGQSVAVVTAASDLSQEQQETLSRKLAGIYGREMTVHVEVDPAVLGGMVIRVGDEVIDGSVAGRLSAVRRALP